MRTFPRSVPLIAAAMFLFAACGAAATTAPSESAVPSAPESPAASASVAPSESPSPSPTPNACAAPNLATLAGGKLTIGTDNPAYPPYFQPPTDGKYIAPWKGPDTGDPHDGLGFESAVAYAIAGKLGFAQADVNWIAVPFDNSFKPGSKPFDMYLAQVSYTPVRAQAVDFSDGYYFLTQAVVALKSNPIAQATSIGDLKKYKFGAQVSTTSYDTIQNVIAPTTKTSVYSSNDAAIQALKAKQIDGLVVDLPTAFYITAAQLDNSVIVGQFPAQPGANAEHFGIVLNKGSALTSCVNQAIAALKTDGTLDQITKEWLADKASAPIFGQ